jgi:hypothetical protein
MQQWYAIGHGVSSVIGDELHVMRVPVPPDEANAPLIVDMDRMLPLPILRQRFPSIAQRNPQILKPRRGVELERPR